MRQITHKDAVKGKIISLLRSTKRAGIENVISWLQESDYFIAPASKKHNNFPGGLAEHSLNVYQVASDLMKIKAMSGQIDFGPSSVIISALLHDVCKVNLGPSEKLGGYHGQKSLDTLLDLGLQLTEPERLAIRYHMGPGFEFQVSGIQGASKAFESYKVSPLIGIIQYSDSNATVFLEK